MVADKNKWPFITDCISPKSSLSKGDIAFDNADQEHWLRLIYSYDHVSSSVREHNRRVQKRLCSSYDLDYDNRDYCIDLQFKIDMVVLYWGIKKLVDLPDTKLDYDQKRELLNSILTDIVEFIEINEEHRRSWMRKVLDDIGVEQLMKLSVSVDVKLGYMTFIAKETIND